MRYTLLTKPPGLLGALMVAACAATPKFDAAVYDATLTPSQVVASTDATQGKAVLWGGAIVQSTNTNRGTQLEVLAYPLNSKQRPNETKPAWGRFLAIEDAYLETMDFAQGRQVTIVGRITSVQQGTIGEATYTYPVVKVDEVFLWPTDKASSGPRFTFGVGVGVGL